MAITQATKDMGVLKRQMGAALKKAGFKPSKRLGLVSRLHGNFWTENFGYNMAKDTTNGDYIYVSGTDYQIKEVVDNDKLTMEHFGLGDPYNISAPKMDKIYNYLGEEKVAIVEYMDTKNHNKEAKDALIQQLYDCLVDNGFGNHITIDEYFLGNHIKITL